MKPKASKFQISFYKPAKELLHLYIIPSLWISKDKYNSLWFGLDFIVFRVQIIIRSEESRLAIDNFMRQIQ